MDKVQIKKQIYDVIEKYYPITFSKILSNIKISKQLLDVLLKDLEKEGKIGFSPIDKVYSILIEAKVVLKEYSQFAITPEKDYYLIPAGLSNVYDGDTCLIMVLEKSEPNDVAKVIRVTARAKQRLIGEVKLKNRKGKSNIYFKSTEDLHYKCNLEYNLKNIEYIGKIVTAQIIYNKNLEIDSVNIIEALGDKDTPGIDILEIAAKYGFDNAFNDNVIEEIEAIPDSLVESDYNNRIDYTNKTIITIDGDDSKDFDDAVSLEINSNGNYVLGVYIADVAHYVKEKKPLDDEALKRGTSLYLADRVIPMLPKKLSNGICSLNEGVDRLVMAAIMELDPKGKLVSYDINEGVIRSTHRMTYNKVNKMLAGDNSLIEEYNDIYPMILKMKDLSDIIRKLRYKKGGIEFDTKEYKFKLNDDCSVNDIIERDRGISEKIIEDFMLLANETVAYHMNIMNLPIVYRIHEKPDQEKLHIVFSTIANMGVRLKNVNNDIHPKQIQEILSNIDDNPNKYIINNMLLRSMMKAKYSQECLGHYGLAMNYYCHFTSPIRRYPDLMTHRMIKKLLLHPTDLENDIIKYKSLIKDISNQNSISERKSIDCEREVDDMLYASYMQKRIGRCYKGIITSITKYGMYVEIERGIEGLVAYRNLDGYFEYDEIKMCASNGSITFNLGDSVDIRVIDADKYTRNIDFVICNSKEDEYEDYMSK